MMAIKYSPPQPTTTTNHHPSMELQKHWFQSCFKGQILNCHIRNHREHTRMKQRRLRPEPRHFYRMQFPGQPATDGSSLWEEYFHVNTLFPVMKWNIVILVNYFAELYLLVDYNFCLHCFEMNWYNLDGYLYIM